MCKPLVAAKAMISWFLYFDYFDTDMTYYRHTSRNHRYKTNVTLCWQCILDYPCTITNTLH
jgi:hypothetical protein